MTIATRTFTVQLAVRLAEERDARAGLLQCPRRWIAKEALIGYLAREKEKRRRIREGLDDVARQYGTCHD